jgi:hypothetical protein
MIQKRIDTWLAPLHRWEEVQFARLVRTRSQWGPQLALVLALVLLGVIGYLDGDRIYPACEARSDGGTIYIKGEMTGEFSAAYFENLGWYVRREYPGGGRLYSAGSSFETEDLRKATRLALREVLERRFGAGTVQVDWGRSKLPGSDEWISNCILLQRFAIVGGDR